jgi:hypothetical protein
MSEKKHIDELFKEQLQNFEATPSPDVWNNIQAKMRKEEEEDRKVIPIWWKLGGVAAALALLLALNFVFDPFGDKTEPVLVNEDKTNTPAEEDTNTPILEESTFNKDAISSELDKEESMDDAVDKNSLENNAEKTLKDKITDESKNDRKAVAVENDANPSKFKTRSENIKKINSVDAISKNDAIGVTSEKDDPIQNKVKDINPLIKKDASEGIETNVATGVAKTTNETEGVNEKVANEVQKTIKGNEALIKKDLSGLNKTSEKVADVDSEKKDAVDAIITDTEEKKKSIFDAIEEDKEDVVATVEENNGKNWEVTPNFGPVFYNSLSGGSAIDPSFADNSQSGDVNFSYGVQVSYAINDRLSLRSGVSNVDLGYTTGGVELATGPVAVALSSVDYGGRSVVLTALDRGTLSNLPPPQGGEGLFGGLTPKSTGGNAELSQNLSYYEVPLELKYALLNKRFGVNMIGGISTLFLGDNEISVQDGTFKDVLGGANNLNSVSFSTNIGLGFDYKISKRLKFNVEPMFKYQLNPYSDSSVDFKPYYFGVYSGLSFKF